MFVAVASMTLTQKYACTRFKIGRLNISKISVVSKLIYRVDTLPVEFQQSFP